MTPEAEEQQFESEDTPTQCPVVSSLPGAKKAFNDAVFLQMSAGDHSLKDCAFVEEMSKEEMEQYTSMIMEEAMKPARETDPWELVAEALPTLDYATVVPEVMRPLAYKDQQIAAIAADDPYQNTPRFDVSKAFTDVN